MTEFLRKRVTAKEIFDLSVQYDIDQRGGVGRGEMDQELAYEIAHWINKRDEVLDLIRASEQPETDR